jgi:hypothetical protein
MTGKLVERIPKRKPQRLADAKLNRGRPNAVAAR